MLTLRMLKAKAAARCGDTSGATSILWRDHLTDFCNWTLRNIEQDVRRKCKQKDFFYGEHGIDTSGAAPENGPSGDYPLPLDFGAVIPPYSVTCVNAEGYEGTIEGVSLGDFQKIRSDSGLARSVYVIHGKKPQRYIRFWPAPIEAGTTFLLAYDKTAPVLVSDNDPVTLFPENDGWEPIIVAGMASYAYAHHQGTFADDPAIGFQNLLEYKIMSMNADAPDNKNRPVHMDDTEAIHRLMDRGYLD